MNDELVTINIKRSTLEEIADTLEHVGNLEIDNAHTDDDEAYGHKLWGLADELRKAWKTYEANVNGEPYMVKDPPRKPHVHVEQHYYTDYIWEYGATTLEDFALIFDVHESTAKRNLDGLAGQGKVYRVRRDASGTLYDLTAEERRNHERESSTLKQSG